MINQPQTELEKAEIASAGAMNDLVLSMLHGVPAKVDDQEVGKACGYQESGQVFVPHLTG
jgi:hypothetical protein